MQDFLNNLYEIENFTTYLSIAIAVLVVLFLLVLFLGKKDQKLEETKRLERIELDGFKETSVPVKAEVNVEQFATTTMPVLETSDLNVVENTVSMPVINEVPEESTLAALQDLTDGNIELPKMKVEESVLPVIEPEIFTQDESNEPISLSELTMPEQESVLPKIKEEPKFAEVIPNEEVILPEFNFDDVINSLNEETTIINPVETEEIVPVLNNEIPSIDAVMPTLVDTTPELIVQEEPIKKPIGQPIFSSVYVPKKPEDDIIDLTSIGESAPVVSDEKIETNASFSNILGETYNIK